MYIKYLQLINFRNYTNLSIEFGKNVNVFIGDNAQGKTNVLESIYYSSIGKSQRTNKDKELINWNAENAYLQVYVSKKSLDKKIEIKIFKEGKKGINVNSIKFNKLSQLFGVLNVVMFSPEDLRTIKEAPSFRRKFLNMELCKLSEKYYHDLIQYNKILNERNKLLKSNNLSNINKMIDIYDKQMCKFGTSIIKKRKHYLEKINNVSGKIHTEITGGKENIEFKYYTYLNFDEDNNIQSCFYNKLCENRKKDIEKRITSIGPHRDDFLVKINGIDVRSFGSQGQQRTAILTLKFASMEVIKDITGEYPVLLLDDVLSELDSKRQKYILNSISNIQTIITCTGLDNMKKYLNSNSKVFKVINGNCRCEIF